ncbi:bacteriohemerythrin [Azoarcus olearius]|uniref:Hemerythrin-like protein n=1 Tax=Azoarcus sp. (strain BH72) TaxID=418699 RepID=A1K2U7_AZOSB|nr:hemerythrin domain-containing protein [Azoarcus olearius]ANQ83621.1 putative hemerythrin-like protein [Azoarcus olearius]CAL93152.1 putative hemerythrin-like protein [Azoarcus olearius]
MAELVWDDARHTLGVAEMDATHREFVELVGRLAAADDASFPKLFAEFHDHTRDHFFAEDAKMKATRFNAIGEHISEHQRVLIELRSFNRNVQAGRMRFARAYVRENLKEWFDLHLATMDSALAAHLKQLAAKATTG